MVNHVAHEVTTKASGAGGQQLQEGAIDLPAIMRPTHDKLVISKHKRHPDPHQQHPSPGLPFLPDAHQHGKGKHAKRSEQGIVHYLIYPAGKKAQSDGQQIEKKIGVRRRLATGMIGNGRRSFLRQIVSVVQHTRVYQASALFPRHLYAVSVALRIGFDYSVFHANQNAGRVVLAAGFIGRVDQRVTCGLQ